MTQLQYKQLHRLRTLLDHGVVADDAPVLRHVPSKTPKQIAAEARHRDLCRQHLDGSLWRDADVRSGHR